MNSDEDERETADDADTEIEAAEAGEVLDARLVPAAVCCWGATLVALLWGWRAGVGLAIGCAAIGIGLSVLMLRSARSGGEARWSGGRGRLGGTELGGSGDRSERCHDVGARSAGGAAGSGLVDIRSRVGCVLVGALVIGAGFAGAGAWHEHRVEVHPLREVRNGQRLVAVVVGTDDPKAVAGKPFGGPKVMMRARLVEYQLGGRTVRAGGAVVVLAPAAAWRAVLPGQRVEFRGKVGPPWRTDLTVAVLRAEGVPMAIDAAPWWQRVAGRVRRDFADAAQRTLPADAAGLLPGLVIGDTSHLTEHVQQNFEESDLTHLTAVSGANVTILLGVVLVSMRALTVDPRIGAAAAALALVMFVILARPSPSVLRAAVMGAVALLGMCTGRRK